MIRSALKNPSGGGGIKTWNPREELSSEGGESKEEVFLRR